jgi:hypothetical protein
LLNDYAYPWIGRRPIGDIEPPELLAVLKRAEDKGVLETARRLRSLSLLWQKFDFAIPLR